MEMGQMPQTFHERLRAAQQRQQSLLCVGPDPARFPEVVGRSPEAITAFNRAIIEATQDLACCYKPNLGFYLPYGHAGIDALAQLRDDVPAHIPLLLDAKIGDISTTSASYAKAYFEAWRMDSVTVHPYMGHDSLQPLLDYQGHAVFVLTKTSNPGSGLLQDRRVADEGGSEPVSHVVTRHAQAWNTHGNVGLVVGATYPHEIAAIRAIAPELPFLIPGIGPQAGDLEGAVTAGLDAVGYGILVNASRAISYASNGPDFQDAARAVATDLRKRINAVRGME
jgi:orotidine-5'-phosphate decarboxylase